MVKQQSAKRPRVGRDHLRETSAAYAGVIAEIDGWRLIATLHGTEYVVQRPEGAGWQRVRAFRDASDLRRWLAVVAIDPPADLAGAAAVLPGDPAEWPGVPAPRRAVAQ